MAGLLKKGFLERGYSFYLESPTNQQFVILENEEMDALKEKVAFSFWEKYDDTHSVVRFATSWATKETQLAELFSLLKQG